MKKAPPLPYRARDLLAAGGISQRTLTRWFAHGILGPAPRRGPGVRYSQEQILRARAAASLRVDNPGLDDVRRLLDGASRAQLEAWAQGSLSPAAGATASPAAPTYPVARYDHIDLAPGLTLLVRADCDPVVRDLAQDIYTRYGPARR